MHTGHFISIVAPHSFFLVFVMPDVEIAYVLHSQFGLWVNLLCHLYYKVRPMSFFVMSLLL